MGGKSEPKTLVSSPVQQDTNLASTGEVKLKRVNKILGVGTKLVPDRTTLDELRGYLPQNKEMQPAMVAFALMTTEETPIVQGDRYGALYEAPNQPQSARDWENRVANELCS